MANGHDEQLKRWTAKRRVALVVEIMRGDTSVAEAARKHGLTVAELENWRERFLAGAENALRSRPTDEDGQKEPAPTGAAPSSAPQAPPAHGQRAARHTRRR